MPIHGPRPVGTGDGGTVVDGRVRLVDTLPMAAAATARALYVPPDGSIHRTRAEEIKASDGTAPGWQEFTRAVAQANGFQHRYWGTEFTVENFRGEAALQNNDVAFIIGQRAFYQATVAAGQQTRVARIAPADFLPAAGWTFIEGAFNDEEHASRRRVLGRNIAFWQESSIYAETLHYSADIQALPSGDHTEYHWDELASLHDIASLLGGGGGGRTRLGQYSGSPSATEKLQAIALDAEVTDDVDIQIEVVDDSSGTMLALSPRISGTMFRARAAQAAAPANLNGAMAFRGVQANNNALNNRAAIQMNWWRGADFQSLYVHSDHLNASGAITVSVYAYPRRGAKGNTGAGASPPQNWPVVAAWAAGDDLTQAEADAAFLVTAADDNRLVLPDLAAANTVSRLAIGVPADRPNISSLTDEATGSELLRSSVFDLANYQVGVNHAGVAYKWLKWSMARERRTAHGLVLHVFQNERIYSR